MERKNHIGLEQLVVVPTGDLDGNEPIRGERGSARVSGKSAYVFDRPSGGES